MSPSGKRALPSYNLGYYTTSQYKYKDIYVRFMIVTINIVVILDLINVFI